jgi:hypothetical protein
MNQTKSKIFQAIFDHFTNNLTLKHTDFEEQLKKFIHDFGKHVLRPILIPGLN